MTVKVIGAHESLVYIVEEIVEILPRLHFRAFGIDFKNLKQIKIFTSFEEYSAFMKEQGVTLNEGDYKGVLGKYDPIRKEIHMFEYNAPEEIDFVMGLLHELSHYIMDDHDLFSVKRYKTDLIYRFYEEIRVNNMSYYLAKQLLVGESLVAAKKFVEAFDAENRSILQLIKEELPTALNTYISNGRGVATLYDL